MTPPGLRATRIGTCVQTVAVRPLSAERSNEVEVLTETDGPEMCALAALTEPGPFLLRTPEMGRFLGIRRAGKLVAMAGERLRFPGYTEVSGVCTHPDFRGQGFARRLSAAVTSNIQLRDERAFLHVWTSNTSAISLYRSLGFEMRTMVHLAVFEQDLGPQ